MREQGKFSAHLERLRTVPGLGRDVSALTVIVIAGVIATAIIKMYLGGSAPWSPHTLVKADFQQVPGLNPSAQTGVTMAGVRVGHVDGVRAASDGTAVVTMSLDGNYQVYRDARAVLRPKNPLNEMQIELNPGSASAGQLRNDTIPVAQTARPIQAEEILDHLDSRTQLAITDLLTQSDAALARAPQTLPGGIASTNKAVVALGPVVAALQTRREKIAQLVSALSTIASAVGSNDDRVNQLATATQATLSTLASSDAQMGATLAALPGLTTDLNNAMAGTTQLTTQLNPTLDNLRGASQTLPGALDKFRSTLSNLNDTVVAAKPVLSKANSVLVDLGPLVANVRTAMPKIEQITAPLDRDTASVMSYLTDIQAFVYNTSSVFGAGDANGSIIRGHLIVPLPGGGVLPNSPTQGQ